MIGDDNKRYISFFHSIHKNQYNIVFHYNPEVLERLEMALSDLIDQVRADTTVEVMCNIINDLEKQKDALNDVEYQKLINNKK
jgi:hypothetical protein